MLEKAEGPVLRALDGGVLHVTLNRPDALNALTLEMHEALFETWTAAADPAVRAVVLTGAGRGFCAGADLRAGASARRPVSLRQDFHPHILALAGLPKPVIAAVNGAAAGAGLSLACAADIRIAARSAKFVPAFVRIGVVPDGGGSYFLTRILGYSRAFEWLATGRTVLADEALSLGLVTRVVDDGDLQAEAGALARTLASQPGDAVGLTKAVLGAAAGATLAEQLEREAAYQERALRAPGRAEARAAALPSRK